MSKTESRGFEEALKDLEQRVKKLDGGELPLEEALTVFEEGISLVRECQSLLDGAETRIMEITSIKSTQEESAR